MSVHPFKCFRCEILLTTEHAGDNVSTIRSLPCPENLSQQLAAHVQLSLFYLNRLAWDYRSHRNAFPSVREGSSD